MTPRHLPGIILIECGNVIRRVATPWHTGRTLFSSRKVPQSPEYEECATQGDLEGPFTDTGDLVSTPVCSVVSFSILFNSASKRSRLFTSLPLLKRMT